MARRAKGRMTGGNYDRVNVPMVSAYTIANDARQRVQLFCAREIVETLIVGPGSVTGESISLDMNPLKLAQTKLKQMALNFEKFRFRKAKLTIACNFSTSVSGSIMVGFSENPEFAIGSGPLAVKQTFSLPYAKSTALYAPVDCMALFNDKGKWYNLDQDSSERMSTTQGKFVLTIQSPVSVTTAVSIPVMLDYEVEFAGSALQLDEESSPVLTFPSVTITSNGSSANSVVTTINTGEPAYPPFVAGRAYVMNPSLQVPIFGNITAEAEVIVLTTTTPSVQFRFCESVESFNNGASLQAEVSATPSENILPRTTVTQVN
jgi:hypothetical protein